MGQMGNRLPMDEIVCAKEQKPSSPKASIERKPSANAKRAINFAPDSQAQWWSATRNTMDWVFLGLYLAEFVLKIYADRLDFFSDGW